MALLTPITVTGSTATALSFVPAELGGDTVAYRRDMIQIIVFRKTTGTNNVTITAARTSVEAGRDVATMANLSFSIGPGVIRAVLVTPAFVGADGLVAITYNLVGTLEVCVLQI